MNQLATFTPLMRQSVGFDRFNDLFESLLSDSADKHFEAYPPYNIEKLGEDEYRITLAVAGFSGADLDIMVENDRLKVSGSQTASEEEKGKTYLHRGIAARSFERVFRLADHIRVEGADLSDGLLTIELVREIPEEKKPRMIQISSGGGKSLLGKAAKAKK